MEYYAHSKENEPLKKWQPLEEHLTNVATRAAEFSKDFGAESWGYTAGLLHDLGKYSKEFQGYLRNVNGIDDEFTEVYRNYNRTKVIHAFSGGQFTNGNWRLEFGRLLAYVICGHHSGLPNGKDTTESSLEKRLKKQVPDYSASPDFSFPDLDESIFSNLQTPFDLQFFIRMIFSSLVDADFLDTEKFISPEISESRQVDYNLPELFDKLQKYVEQFGTPVNTIDIHRAEIYQQALSTAEQPSGFFSLTVPTGGGKTLSSMAFALKHAIKHGKTRIIYVIPYTSIIEQNAAVFKKVFGKNVVLEHHSNYIPEKEDRFNKLSAENWDAPVVVTTNVQFFESIFANRTSKCRKLHNMANSVVIFDEAQMLPVPLLDPCLESLKSLVRMFNSSVVLCTATQPALHQRKGFDKGIPQDQIREIVSNPKELAQIFQRVNIQILPEKLSIIELASQMAKEDQVLTIVNTKKQARLIFEELASCSDPESIFHLSTFMYPAHRKKVLKQINDRLDAGLPCKVVSTQLIEAGVDIDFPVVFRAMAGIDSIAQAAGRCNRHGKRSQKGQVYVFSLQEQKLFGMLQTFAEAGDLVLQSKPDPLSLDTIEAYFRRVYWDQHDHMDKFKVVDKINRGFEALSFPFKEIAKKFEMIDSGTESLIIPDSDVAEQLIRKIRYNDFVSKEDLRQLQKFTVQIYPNILAKLAGSVEYLNKESKQLLILQDTAKYNKFVGLNPDCDDYDCLCGPV